MDTATANLSLFSGSDGKCGVDVGGSEIGADGGDRSR